MNGLDRQAFADRSSATVLASESLQDFVLLDLRPMLDTAAISSASTTAAGAFNVWGNSYPAEALPPGGSLLRVGGVPFRFPPTDQGRMNTMRCAGQVLAVPADRYDWLYVLAASERRTEDYLYLHYASGDTDPEWLRVSDFWPAPARFGELVAVRCPRMHYPHHVQSNLQPTIWCQRVPISRQTPLRSIHLPDNLAIHIFATTLVKTPASLAGPAAANHATLVWHHPRHGTGRNG